MALNSYLTLRAPINIRHSASMVSWVLRNRMTITAQPGVEIQNGLLANNPTAPFIRGKYTGNSLHDHQGDEEKLNL